MKMSFYHSRGLSQVELVILVAVVGIIAGIGVGVNKIGLINGAREVKMQQDHAVLNSAVKSYLASGGDLDGVDDATEVVSRLKASLSDEVKNLTPGLSGGFLDERAFLTLQTDEEAAAGKPRLRWDAASKRFTIAYSGAPGIRTVSLGDVGTSNVGDDDANRKSSLSYASKDDWIWDYSEAMPAAPTGPTVIPVTEVPTTSPSNTPVPPPVILTNKQDLLPPQFTVPGGNFVTSQFPLSVSLTNPNPQGSSHLFYSIDYAAWKELLPGLTFPVPANAFVKAQAIPYDSTLWNQSSVVNQEYKALMGALRPPDIEFSSNNFSSGTRSIQVTLFDLNSSGTSLIHYQIMPVPGSSGVKTDLAAYAGKFSVNASDYPGGFGVSAYAKAISPDYVDSPFASRYATEEQGLFDGHLDLDTSVTISEIGKGSTGAHTHDITGKYGIKKINFFSLPESKQIELDEAIQNPKQMFKLIVVNGDLSPGLSLTLDYQDKGESKTVTLPVNEYDDTATRELMTFSLSGSSNIAKLKGLAITMSQDIISTAGVIPTNTGDVKSNVLGKNSEWRNGALTIQAVAVGSDGKDAFTTSEFLSAGGHGVAQSGMLWEAALFWHWDGDSYHESGNSYKPGAPNSIRGLLAEHKNEGKEKR